MQDPRCCALTWASLGLQCQVPLPQTPEMHHHAMEDLGFARALSASCPPPPLPWGWAPRGGQATLPSPSRTEGDVPHKLTWALPQRNALLTNYPLFTLRKSYTTYYTCIPPSHHTPSMILTLKKTHRMQFFPWHQPGLQSPRCLNRPADTQVTQSIPPSTKVDSAGGSFPRECTAATLERSLPAGSQ